MFKIISLFVLSVMLMNVGAASVNTDFKKCSDVAKNNRNWNVLIMSDSANFENSNTVVCYHITDSKTIKIRTAAGKVYNISWAKLYKMECYFYRSVPKTMFKTDGSLSANLDEIRNLYMRGKL